MATVTRSRPVSSYRDGRGHVYTYVEATALLAAAAVYNAGAAGTAYDTWDGFAEESISSHVGAYTRIRSTIVTDQAGTLVILQSMDGVNWVETDSQAVVANGGAADDGSSAVKGIGFEFTVKARYVAVAFKNTGASTQTKFILWTSLLGL